MYEFKTVKQAARFEHVIEKSRFIAHIKPVLTAKEAEEFIGEIKKKYKEATHNVPAMIVGNRQEIQWASDDGEPQGTSGPPIVKMMVQENITNVALVVTRYFGGTKLGTGGLVRAYTATAKLGLEMAEIITLREKVENIIEYQYQFQGKVESIVRKVGGDVCKKEFGEKVKLSIVIELENQSLFEDLVKAYQPRDVELLEKVVVFK